MNMDAVLQTFLIECGELLEEMEQALLAVEAAPDKSELVNAIFRAAHTIKGSAGLFGLDHVVSFTHVLESVLDEARGGRLLLADQLVALLLACGDHIGAMVAVVASGRMDADTAISKAGAPLVQALHAYLEPGGSAVVAAIAPAPSGSSQSGVWHITVRFGSEVLKNGMDPLSFIGYLGTLGQIVAIVTLDDGLPQAAAMDPECCYLGFHIVFRSSADVATIEGAFEFVRDDCVLQMVAPGSPVARYAALLGDLAAHADALGDLLLLCGTMTATDIDGVLALQAAPEPVSESESVAEPVAEPVAESAAAPVAGPADRQPQPQPQGEVRATTAKTAEHRSIRVDADKLDQLINLVGELIIVSASAKLIAGRAQIAELHDCASTLATLVENVRDSALQLRMVKIGATFNRFQRVVHDVAREIGKDIVLQVSGVDTELDKTVVERIGDPLTHLLRNAMDHGIEPAAVRAAHGKPAVGVVKLDACHDSGSIVITVSDDGGGLDRERILAKAIERGLVEPGRVLGENEIYALIFEPGFSTAAQITNLSGRGVGMDVVKRNINALRGSVGVHSEAGRGTTITVRLPLTLAIIDGFQVGVGPSVFVIPLDMIEECVQFSCEPGHDYTNLRGQVLPLVRLRDLFAIDAAAVRRESIVVVHHAGQRCGIVVDTLIGEFQAVIKPLAKLFNQVACISGSTILGSGEVALIFDVPALFAQLASQRASAGAS
ncbi:chemotaxis protein CheA [Massilia sp. PWRC2]|uniref:chemotaxis protein CheA n=1 Tax=Massilia sp. PWRC2 TaxID=2804626 RepID=UPI003CF81813